MIDKINIEVLKDFIQSGNINFLIGSGLSRPFLPVLGNIEKQMASVKDAPVNKQEALAAVLYKEYFEKVKQILLTYAKYYAGYEIHGNIPCNGPGKAEAQTLDEAILHTI